MSPSPTDLLAAVAAETTPRYLEPHRHYHGLAHVQALLAGLDAHRALARDPVAIALAIWFHDAVYDPQRPDNEQASAALAAERLPALGAPSALADQVAAMVRATERHEWTDGDPDTALFLDLDLGVLATPWPVYSRYAEGVAQEYAWVPAPLFAARRIEVLNRLLARPTLYFTPALATAWDAPARANLTREIEALKEGIAAS